MDRIVITDLLVRCIIGVNREERTNLQDVLINISLETDLRKAGKSDRLEDSVDYRSLAKEIIAMTEQSRFQLVEALAEAIVDICLTREAVATAHVRVEKPGALRFARNVGVEISRKRSPS